MFATQSRITQYQQRPLDYFGEKSDVSHIKQKGGFVDFHFTRATREFSRTEQIYQAGDTVAIVAVYKNLPHHLERLSGIILQNHDVEIIDMRIDKAEKDLTDLQLCV